MSQKQAAKPAKVRGFLTVRDKNGTLKRKIPFEGVLKEKKSGPGAPSRNS